MNPNNSKKIAIVDVDGTLINGQIQQKLIIFFWKNKQIKLWYFVKLNLWFILYKLGLVKNAESVLEYGLKYLNGKSVENINFLIKRFIDEEIKAIIFPKSFELINNLRRDGYSIVILSSAIEAVISHISELFKANDFICTRLEKNAGIYTGKVYGKIIYGNRKVTELNSYLEKHNYLIENTVAYADHESDLDLLRTVNKAFVVNPGNRMYKIAKREGFSIINTH